MSTFGPENFHRLEEFPSFISCIKCFGRPIIPPLLTPSRRRKLMQDRFVAISKEAETRSKTVSYQNQDIHASSMKNDSMSSVQPFIQESCALRYPSYKDNQERISVAISKFPTSGIYSSVHTSAIVCSNVIGNNHEYTSRVSKDSPCGSQTSCVDCIECSHENVNLDCNMCQAEYNQSVHDRSFMSEISPEVPCRTYSLFEPNADGISSEEVNFTVEEAECESLPTVICNEKYVPTDADLESYTTSMTQSTDLEKYMELSCDFSSPDNSAVIWDSKSSSQQYTLSRSDDASSETIVNTENELTPCASTMAELTDNIEDELSNADETVGMSDGKGVAVGSIKRSHSVDSYMKILQTHVRNMNVKKSHSDSFDPSPQTSLGVSDDARISFSSRTGLLIKEDSKESDESKDIPEKDVSVQDSKEASGKDDKTTDSNTSDFPFKKKHIRQNSYTLDEPSSALILSHADCTCNFDANCISPHCSALKDENDVSPNFAFTKERIEVPISQDQRKIFPILNSESEPEIMHKEDACKETVIDVFPVVNEGTCEKSNFGNAKVSESIVSENAVGTSPDLEEKYLNEVFSKNLHLSDDAKHQEHFKRICKELQENYDVRVKDLLEEQRRQWLKLQDEFKEQQQLLYEKLQFTPMSAIGSPSMDENKDLIKNSVDCGKIVKEKSDNKPISDRESSALNASVLTCNQIPVSEKSSVTNPIVIVPSRSPQRLSSPEKTSLHVSVSPCNQTPVSDNSPVSNPIVIVASDRPQLLSSPEKTSVPSLSPRASISPSREYTLPNSSPSIPLENTTHRQLFNGSGVAVHRNFSGSENHVYSSSEPMPGVSGFPFFNSAMLPHSHDLLGPPNAIAVPIDKKCDKASTCFCDNSVQQCKCCAYFNGYSENDVNTSQPENTSFSREHNDSFYANGVGGADLQHFSSVSELPNDSSGNYVHYSSSSNPRKNIPIPSRNSVDITCSMQNVSSLSFNNVKQPSTVDRPEKNSLRQSTKEKPVLSTCSLLSFNTKDLKNVSLMPQDVVSSNKITVDPHILKKFEKLPAFVKGYLTRRLFKSEYVQGLRKNLQDTISLIAKISEDMPTTQESVSQKHVDFHRQLIVQFMTSFDNVYNVLTTTSTKEKMKIIADSRNFRLRQKALAQKEDSNLPVNSNAYDFVPLKTHKLSSATLKARERKKRSLMGKTYTVEDLKNSRSRSVIDMRTYTIDDLPTFRGRAHSSMSKSHSASPTSIYNSSVGTSLKRKTASAKSSGSRRCQWVP